jgi:hypothetical protein
MAANPVGRIIVAALACCAVVSIATGSRSLVAVLLGMAGPLAATIGSWMILERARVRTPDKVSGVMIKLFAAKMILFGAYIAAAIPLLPGARTVFMGSFVSHYIVLHVMEALHLRRLFSVRHGDGRRLGVS